MCLEVTINRGSQLEITYVKVNERWPACATAFPSFVRIIVGNLKSLSCRKCTC